MSFGSAYGFLLVASARNFVAQEGRRLRNPRHLVPALLALGYFAWALRPVVLLPRSGPPLAAMEALGANAAGFATLAIGALWLQGWIWGRPRARLSFNEPEIQFFFPAPTTRRQLVRSRVTKSLLLAALGAAIPALIVQRWAPAPWWCVAIACWLTLATMDLHAAGASFARVRLHALLPERLHLPVRFASLALVGFGLWWGGSALLHPSVALAWLLWPARAIARLFMVADIREAAGALLPAFVVLVLHVIWVLVVAESFEEAALARAQVVARRVEAIRAGGASALVVGGRAGKVPFRLSVRGRPEIALTWSGLIGLSRSLAVRVFFGVLALATILIAALFLTSSPSRGDSGAGRAAAGVIAASLLGYILLLGPALVRSRVASDLLRYLELLRALPLSSARVVFGTTLAPALVLSGLWLLLVPVASLLIPVGLGGLERSVIGISLAAVGPPAILLGVLLQAFTVVLLPSWSRSEQGPLVVGRGMLASVVHLVGFPLLLIPAGVVAAMLGVGGFWLIGWRAILPAAAATSVVLGLEVAVALGVVGWFFDRLDPSDL